MKRWLLASGALVCATGLALEAQQAPLVPSQGIYTAAQAKRGQVFYQDFCEACHGPALAGDTAAPLVGPKFDEGWAGRTYRDLFEKIRTTMPPDAPGTITRPQTAAILSYKLSLEGFPAGSTELTTDTAVLRGMAIAPARP